MATRKRSSIEQLLDNHNEPYELVIYWEPGDDQPMRLYLIQVNDVRLAVDLLDVSAPSRFALQTPLDGKFTVKFALAPMVPIRGAIIGVVNNRTAIKQTVDKTTALQRNQLWRNEVEIDAP